jgi:hypothetical protein
MDVHLKRRAMHSPGKSALAKPAPASPRLPRRPASVIRIRRKRPSARHIPVRSVRLRECLTKRATVTRFVGHSDKGVP